MCTISVVAQDSIRRKKDKPKGAFWDKVYIGGNIGLQFGNSTFLAISPIVGYNFTKKISAGVGITYQYFHYKDKAYDIETNVYGARIFSRYMITENIFGYGEYEYLNLEAFDFFPRRRVDVGSLLGGGGYIQRFSSRASLVAMVLYNFTPSYYTPYQNPVIRVGMNFGL
jgi:hypothetical protein